MKYKTQMLIVSLLALCSMVVVTVYGATLNFNGCGTELDCLRRLFTSVSFAPFFIPSLSILLSLPPLFFVKEVVYLAWRKFAVWALPVMIVLIFISPTSDSGNWGLNLDLTREMASILYSGLFLAISWAITLRSYIKTR